MGTISMRSAVVPVVAALSLVVGLWSPASAAVAGVQIFIDSNDNGVYDGGDVDVTQTVRDSGQVVTAASIVVPEGANLRLRAETVSLRAGKAIHINGTLTSTGSLFLWTETGAITLGPRSLVMADDTLQMTAHADLTIDRARVQGDDVVMIESVGGQIVVGRAILGGGSRLELNGWGDGGLSMEASTLQAPRGIINVHVEGNVQMDQVKITARDVNFNVGGGWTEMFHSTVRVPRTGSITMSVEGGWPAPTTLDLRGTRLYGWGDNIVLSADQVVGY